MRDEWRAVREENWGKLGEKKKWGGRPKGIGGEREEWVSEGRWRRKGREERGKIK